ncbi:hypothetical protein L596_030373 [Steinernema carpocapsae]|uniref:Uncharacterized protein n=1 Tax=Steinernema carpocapsae TaxID=34508 RepID=A0A4U5LP69_STECR|nr:hypothetical protein L596_030373 [Steinernema carpocapsae]
MHFFSLTFFSFVQRCISLFVDIEPEIKRNSLETERRSFRFENSNYKRNLTQVCEKLRELFSSPHDMTHKKW